MTVSYPVAKWLYHRFGDRETADVYVGSELAFSLLTGSAKNNPGVIPAPTIPDAIELLWEAGIQIWYIPEFDCCRGFIKISGETYRLKILCATPEDVYEHCLEYLCRELEDTL